MDTVLHARFDARQVAKITQIQADTGLTISQIFRRLVDAAEVKPLEIKVHLFANAKSDVTLAGTPVAFA